MAARQSANKSFVTSACVVFVFSREKKYFTRKMSREKTLDKKQKTKKGGGGEREREREREREKGGGE